LVSKETVQCSMRALLLLIYGRLAARDAVRGVAASQALVRQYGMSWITNRWIDFGRRLRLNRSAAF